jgi:glycosyltransferase involved in cell wall biosynthesis
MKPNALFMVNGGLGDGIAISHAAIAAQAAYQVYIHAIGGNCQKLAGFWERKSIRVVNAEQIKKIEFDFVGCNCAMSTLKKRVNGLTYNELRVPNSKGTLVEECMQLVEGYQCPENIFKGMFPFKGDVPKFIIGPGVGKLKKSQDKKLTKEQWEEVLPYWNGDKVVIGDDSAKEEFGSMEGATWRDATIEEASGLLSQCKVFVGLEGGLAHLADACGCHVITVLKSTDKRFAPKNSLVVDFTEKEDLNVLIDAVHKKLAARYLKPARVKATEKKLSVIITTHNEGREVSLTVNDVLENAGCPVEVIVVDDGSTDGSCDNLPDSVVLVKNEGKRLGVAPARNLGAKMASGEALMFLDAHMRVRPNVPSLMMQQAVKHQAVIVSCMTALYNDRGGNWHARYNLDKGYLCAKWKGHSVKQDLEPTTAWVAPGWVIPKSIFFTIGPWPVQMENWGSTEVAMSVAANMAKIPILASKEAFVWHKFRNSFPYHGVRKNAVWRNAFVIARGIINSDELVQKMIEVYWQDEFKEILESPHMRALQKKWDVLRKSTWHDFVRDHVDNYTIQGPEPKSEKVDPAKVAADPSAYAMLIELLTSTRSEIDHICERCNKMRKCGNICLLVRKNVSQLDRCPDGKWYRRP